ncbi:saccharopine dehydrogenase family protein [Entomomonas asaccharolytica]|uniref:Saccharopine dehydrogenase NADP-binding domain-containing protein n=1 Tax=Entomomonas asaccharolytica TaxID=2785331 RepID=A0A974NE47_9GAMM|nr:saccharopine dehydrogenase NADP-binding domain-containing protein [Entomomonas asaccharolytica]QQP84988.1 saccharopine dehydrogenase NADP-binding domain-containing protein [Entomomonas asaccharolytica]
MRVLILGGYGNFGQIIARHLHTIAGIELIIAGRNLVKAQQFAGTINAEAIQLDANQADLATILKHQQINLLISTAGPFQGQNYAVAEAAIEAKTHYIDLADGREFVCGIKTLHKQALKQNVLVCAGASSVPGLSSAVINELLPRFAALRRIEIGISTSEKIPGKSTIEGMLAYCGKPIKQWIDGAWQDRFGWQDLYTHQFSEPVGKRSLAACEVPDLSLFVEHYKGVDTVTFSAGTGLKLTHYGTWLFSWLIRYGLISKPQKYAAMLHKNSLRLERFGDGNSAMYIQLTGLDKDQKPLKLVWELIAEANDGVNIPCLSSVALTRKLLAGKLVARGAMSSMGLLTLDEYLAELAGLHITTKLHELYPFS